MSVTFVEDDFFEGMIQDIARPLDLRRTASASQFNRSLSPKSNRRTAPRVNLVASDVVVVVDDQVVNAVDFSLRGIQFRSNIRLVPGSTVMLSIRWGKDLHSMALGRVMWATFEKPGRLVEPHYRVGTEFDSADVRAIRAMLERCGLGRPVDVEVVHSRW